MLLLTVWKPFGNTMDVFITDVTASKIELMNKWKSNTNGFNAKQNSKRMDVKLLK